MAREGTSLFRLLNITTHPLMKKLFFGLFFALVMLFSASGAKAQMNFWNGTPCNLRVWGGYTYDPAFCTPMAVCISPTILIPPFSWGVLPAGPCPPMIGPTAHYIRVIITYPTGATYGTGICGGAPVPHRDCQGNPRTLTLSSTTLGWVI
jgi:hypothetical protein